jgi:hypothetical protein
MSITREARFEVLTAVLTKIQVFWDMQPVSTGK